ncbi:MAG: flavin reductase [Massiliimalia sp.]|jgi:flavin reductase (DIM6/NTAB) family NADH-FMN oxidoreductase RutF/rubredoxin
MDLTVLHDVTYGLYIVGAMDESQPVGCVINTCMQITSENPIFSISLNKGNYTYEVIHKTGRFSLSILSEKATGKLIGDFGFSSSRDRNKYEGHTYDMVEQLPVIKEGVCSALIFEVIQEVDMETHMVIFARLKDTVKLSSDPAMTYTYYHKVIKGKAPKSAPTYLEESGDTAPEAEKWVCSVCGYIYEGDLTKEPDSYVCPICGVGKDMFKKQEATPSASASEKWVCTICGYIYEGDLTKEPDDYVCPICNVGKDMFQKQ